MTTGGHVVGTNGALAPCDRINKPGGQHHDSAACTTSARGSASCQRHGKNTPQPQPLLQACTLCVVHRCSRSELSSINFHSSCAGYFCYRSMGLYRTTVTYLDSNLWVRPSATSGWAPQPFSMKRWLRTMCCGRAQLSSEFRELRTPRWSWDGRAGGSLAKSLSSGAWKL